MIKFKTNSQLKKSNQGNVHFSFLSIHFGNRSFGIAVLGFMVSFYLNQNKDE
jgi:hypothetical protein